MASLYGLESLLWSSSGCPWAMWRFFLPWFWPAEDRVALGSTFWQFGFPSFVPRHFFLLGVGLGLEMEWAKASRTFWPHRNILEYSSLLLFGSFNRGNEKLIPLFGSLSRREHSFLSIPLKPQISIPPPHPKLGGMRGNEIKFNDFFY